MHARGQIREAITNILSRNHVSWKTVIKSSERPDRQIWPYIMVYVDGNQGDSVISSTSTEPSDFDRDVTILVHGMLKLPVNLALVEDLVEEFESEVEKKLTRSILNTELPQASSITLAPGTTTWVVVREEDDIPHIQVVIPWRIGYCVREGSPESLI